MLLQLLSQNPQLYFAIVISVLLSIVLHELGHGYAAIKLGDNTPLETGHMTLNPVVHMGWFSIILACTVGLAWGMMPVDPTRMRGRYAGAIVAVAGPLVNVALCAVSIVLLVVFLKFGVSQLPEHVAKNVVVLLSTMAYLNLALVLLNLIPLPPLDGSRILADFSPQYRNLIADPTMQGVFFACTIAVLIFGGRFILPFAQDTVNSTVVGLLRVVGV